MNSKILYSVKKKSDRKWKESKVKRYKIGTHEVNKVSLSCFDDKRFFVDNGIHALIFIKTIKSKKMY